MSTLIEPTQIIYSKVAELESTFSDLTVYQNRPEVLEGVSSGSRIITFRISNNQPEYDLDKEIENQRITVILDVWANTSQGTSELLVALEVKMREINYLLDTSYAIPDPEQLSHVLAQFIY